MTHDHHGEDAAAHGGGDAPHGGANAAHGDAVVYPATDDHGVVIEHDDDRAHGDLALGPMDVPAWGAGVLGVLLGLAVAAAFVLATGEIRPA